MFTVGYKNIILKPRLPNNGKVMQFEAFTNTGGTGLELKVSGGALKSMTMAQSRESVKILAQLLK